MIEAIDTLTRELQSVARGEPFPAYGSEQCARIMLSLAVACTDAETLNALGVVAIKLLAERAQQSLAAQHEQAVMVAEKRHPC